MDLVKLIKKCISRIVTRSQDKTKCVKPRGLPQRQASKKPVHTKIAET